MKRKILLCIVYLLLPFFSIKPMHQSYDQKIKIINDLRALENESNNAQNIGEYQTKLNLITSFVIKYINLYLINPNQNVEILKELQNAFMNAAIEKLELTFDGNELKQYVTTTKKYIESWKSNNYVKHDIMKKFNDFDRSVNPLKSTIYTFHNELFKMKLEYILN